MAEAEEQGASRGIPSTVDIRIVSPYVGANIPLDYPALPVTTTVLELKGKIRESLPSHPAEQEQRILYRGRLLLPDRSLQDALGVEVLRSGEQQTLHLALHPRHDLASRSSAPTHSSSPRNSSPAPAAAGQRLPEPQAHLHGHPHAHPPHMQRPHHAQHFAPPTVAQLLQQQQQHYQAAMHWMQREAGFRMTQPTQGFQANAHIAQPAAGEPTVTVTREMIGPNGQYHRVSTLENLGGHTPSAQLGGAGPLSAQVSNATLRELLSANQAYNIMQGADMMQATQAMTDAMHRNISDPSLAGVASNLGHMGPVQAIQPGVTTPLVPSSRHASRTGTPDPFAMAPGPGAFLPPISGPPQQHPPSHLAQPEVYILSSPLGPRGLLINSAAETYVTPVMRPPGLPSLSSMHARHLQAPQQSLPPNWPLGDPLGNVPALDNHAQLARNARFRALAQQHQGPPQAPLQPQQPRPQQAAQPAEPVAPPAANFAAAHPRNPAARDVPWINAIWLLVRLAFFVWWFTSGDASWCRWLTILGIAFLVFAVNTGVLNNVANRAWEPFRRHLERLLPLGHDPAPPAAAAAQAASAAAAAPDPAQVAGRLLAQRRNANANWLLHTVRRVERAGLLFVASIAPGVAERHIARLEAQDEAARAVATAAAAAVAAAEAEAEAARATAESERARGLASSSSRKMMRVRDSLHRAMLRVWDALRAAQRGPPGTNRNSRRS